MPRIDKAMTLSDAKAEAKAALESLVAECEREIRNISRFDDERMCVATWNIRHAYQAAIDVAGAVLGIIVAFVVVVLVWGLL